MRVSVLTFSILTLLAGGMPAARADLAGDINAVLADPLLSHATAGIQVVRLGKSDSDIPTLVQSNPTTPFTPASNLKVITTSAALEKLGTDFTFRTLLVYHDGDLIFIGDGDPTLGDAEMLKKVGWDVDTVFNTWAASLTKRHMLAARNLLIDDSVFDQQFMQPHWPADQVDRRYVAETAGINLNANCLDFYVDPAGRGLPAAFHTNPATGYATIKNICIGGNENSVWLSRDPQDNLITLHGQAATSNIVPVSVTIHDPPMYAGTVLSEILTKSGLVFSGKVQRDLSQRAAYEKAVAAGDKSWVLLAVHETPLINVVSRANKDSMNLYAECVCKRLGYATTGTGSWANGTAAVGQFLASLNIPADQYTLDDGCGLSKQNAISPNAMVTVLAHAFFSKNARIWLNSLSVAGADGTLAERFRGSDLRGRVIAKTGFVEGVSCLSGYLHAKDDNWYCFSIMFKGIPKLSNSAAKILQERIVKAVDVHSRSAVADDR